MRCIGLVLLAAVLVTAVGCESDSTTAPLLGGESSSTAPQFAATLLGIAEGVVTGTVVDTTGTPIEGAAVFVRYCLGDSARWGGEHPLADLTGADGEYRIEEVPEGEQTVVTRARGYLRFEDTVVVPETGTAVLDIVLIPADGSGSGPGGPGPHGERNGECHERGEGQHGPGGSGDCDRGEGPRREQCQE
jgi:hypothetical protein